MFKDECCREGTDPLNPKNEDQNAGLSAVLMNKGWLSEASQHFVLSDANRHSYQQGQSNTIELEVFSKTFTSGEEVTIDGLSAGSMVAGVVGQKLDTGGDSAGDASAPQIQQYDSGGYASGSGPDACDDADSSKWSTDQLVWQSTMAACTQKCKGQGACSAACMEGDGWTSGCAGCFADHTVCMMTNCAADCTAGSAGAECISCQKEQGCETKTFGAGSCTGLDPPSTVTDPAAQAAAFE
jgi:hypothetical protein